MATDKQILETDFYDLCGVGSIGMSDDDKIKYWRSVVEKKSCVLSKEKIIKIAASDSAMHQIRNDDIELIAVFGMDELINFCENLIKENNK